MRWGALVAAVVVASCASSTGHRPRTAGEAASGAAMALTSYRVRDQKLPDYLTEARAEDFQTAPGVAALHYYGSGGWGIAWRGKYLLTAPYFSNHTLAAMQTGLALRPDLVEVRDGLKNTPVARTDVILIGHGHLDHAGDVPALFEPGLISTRPALVADVSTVNLFEPIREKFGCISTLDYFVSSEANPCLPPEFRVTAIHSSHAPHAHVGGLEVEAYGGVERKARRALPLTATDYKLGNTWAYLIDLIDERGEIALRIHYADAAAESPHGFAQLADVARHDVDIQIACVAGYDGVPEYPQDSLEHHRTRYVLAAHWEDFFLPRRWRLKPVNFILDEGKMDDFLERVEKTLGTQSRGVAPLNKSAKDCDQERCGPRGANWALPIPGETFHFGPRGDSAG